MTPGDRIKILRASYLGLTLEQFGDALGVGKTAISKLEKNERNLTKQMAKAICREYSVNYTWLTTGEGDMFKDTSLIERLETFLANDFDGSFTALFNAILDLNDSERQALSVLIQKSGRRQIIILSTDLPHHRTYRSVYGGSLVFTYFQIELCECRIS